MMNTQYFNLHTASNIHTSMMLTFWLLTSFLVNESLPLILSFKNEEVFKAEINSRITS